MYRAPRLVQVTDGKKNYLPLWANDEKQSLFIPDPHYRFNELEKKAFEMFLIYKKKQKQFAVILIIYVY